MPVVKLDCAASLNVAVVSPAKPTAAETEKAGFAVLTIARDGGGDGGGGLGGGDGGGGLGGGKGGGGLGGGNGGGNGGGGDGGGGLGVATHAVSVPTAAALPTAHAAVSVWLLRHVEHVVQMESKPPPAVTLPGRHTADVQLPEAHTVHVCSVVSTVALHAAAA